MVSEYPQDYILIVIVLIVGIAGILQIFRNRRKFSFYKEAMPFVLGGVLLPLFSTIGNCFIANRWDISYIISFLYLKKVSDDWFFRHLASWGCIFLSWGIAILLIVLVKAIKQKREGSKI